MERDRIFISYSHKDMRHLEAFQEIASPLLSSLPYEVWDDRRIKPGNLWREEIDRALNSAKIAVLLVSASFLASDFIRKNELTEILKAQKKDGLIVFWIALNYAAFGAENVGLDAFQCANDPKRPLLHLQGAARAKGWLNIAERLVKIAGVDQNPDCGRRRIVILHQPDLHPDEEVLDLLDEGLKAKDFEVYTIKKVTSQLLDHLDSHLTRADAVIPLISRHSATSEELEAHFSVARRHSQRQSGRPRLVPLFIQYAGDAAGALTICPNLPHIRWNGPADDRLLTQRVLEILRQPEQAVEITPAAKVQGRHPAATAPQIALADSSDRTRDPYYVRRETDDQTLRTLEQWQTLIVRIKGSRQMGKTALLGRAARHAGKLGAKVVLTDFQSFNVSQFSALESLYKGLLESMFEQLRLDDLSIESLWRPQKPPNSNLTAILKKYVLPSVGGRFLWAMDEVDRLFPVEHLHDFFRLMRAWFSERRLGVDTTWDQCTIVIAYATEARLFLPNPNESPFNVGKETALSDFTKDQLAELNEIYCRPLKNQEQIADFYSLVSGQPFLCRRGLEVLKGGEEFPTFLHRAGEEGGPYTDHLRYLAAVLDRSPVLAQAVRSYFSEKQILSQDEFDRLWTAGIFVGQSPELARPRCKLYDIYLKKRSMPKRMRKGA